MIDHLNSSNDEGNGESEKFQKKKALKASKRKLIRYLKDNFELSENGSSKTSPRGSKEDEVLMESKKLKEL